MAETTPNRPDGVPANARWIAATKEWELGAVVAGKRQGPFRSWRDDGTLSCESTFLDGLADGPFKRFHPSGEIAMAGRYASGALDGVLVARRSHEPTTENVMPEAAPEVWEVRRHFEAGAGTLPQFLSRGGEPLTRQGTPCPARPDDVDELAVWLDEEWVLGRVKGTSERVGAWRHWTKAGLRSLDLGYDDRGKLVAKRQYRSGQPFLSQRFDPNVGDDCVVEQITHHGKGRPDTARTFSFLPDGQRYEHASSCQFELDLVFSNRETCLLPQLHWGDSWNASVAVRLQELLGPAPAKLTFMPMFPAGYGTSLLAHVDVASAWATLDALAATLTLESATVATIPYAGDALVLERRGEHLLTWNQEQRGRARNHSVCEIYEVPWSHWCAAIRELVSRRDEVTTRLRIHMENHRRGDLWSEPVDGLAARARVSNRKPVLGEAIEAFLDLENRSAAVIHLVNDFEWNVSRRNSLLTGRVLGTPRREALKRPPVRLEPGQVFSVSTEIVVSEISEVAISYGASRDTEHSTNMPIDAYLRSVGDRYDLSACWQGALDALAIALLVSSS
jgi:hypothetical protein